MTQRASTGRRSGPTTSAASRASSSTPATPTRPARPPRRGSASSRAARRSSTPRGRAPRPRSCSRFARPGDDGRARRGRLLRHLGAAARARAWGVRAASSTTRPGRRPTADIVWVESPANPTLTDARLGGAAARTAGSSSATRPSRRPSTSARSTRAPTIVIHSATKFLTGSHNALLGATVTARPRAQPRGCARCARGRGSPPRRTRPARCSTGLDSLERRMAPDHRHRERARTPARRPPGGRARPLPGLLRADLVRRRRPAARSRPRTRVIMNATSLGGVNSTMESRHRWEGDRIPRGLLRLSVGLEDVEELWDDLAEALA